MKPVAFLALTSAIAIFAAPALAQSGKPMTKADFEKQQTSKYKRYDANGDGTVTADELMKTRPNRADGSAWTLEATQKWLARRDANGDGTVTVVEAVAFEMPRFDKMDANKDGKVTADERASEPK
ncbi:hypothetical protein [Sphingomonas sp.]|uniref:hypothetical protein n=1 Tax=Sphingomonas sp. TaxID=28214 RepID=UPI002DD62C31|nr:hypothetical protein [Sphingomonas sp.]